MSTPLLIHADPALNELDIRDVWRGAQSCGIHDGHLFRTSGTTGAAKWVYLKDSALAASAEAVNLALGARSDDIWLLALPDYHVAGYQILMRAKLSGAKVVRYQGKWDPRSCLELIEKNRVTYLSLVPTQVVDLVQAGLRAPDSIKCVLVGGGALVNDIGVAFEALGWPYVCTYGMTEAASTIAMGKRHLKPLTCWDIRIGETIELRGSALFTGYLVKEKSAWVLQKPFHREGWFLTSDRGGLKEGVLEIFGRSDSVVKILGELVDTMKIEKQLPLGVFVVALPHARQGNELLAVAKDEAVLEPAVKKWNQQCIGFQRLRGLVVSDIPLSGLGKLKRKEFAEIIKNATYKE